MPPRLVRRTITIPLLFGVTLVVSALSPVLLAVAVAFDLCTSRQSMRFTRCIAFVVRMGWIESVGVTLAAGVWVRSLGVMSRPRPQQRVQGLMRWYSHAIVRAASQTLGLRIDATRTDSVDDDAPLLCFAHHTSLLDSLLPVEMLARERRRQFRYVLKQSLEWAPAFDLVGNWGPVHFVNRSGRDSSCEARQIGDLVRNLGPGDTAVIFPEGTFFNARRLQRAVEQVRRNAPALAERASRLAHVLPPRIGGASAMLDAAPEVDVLFLAHTGFERFTSIAESVRAVPFRDPIKVMLRRVAHADIPVGGQRYEWLFTEFEVMDRWVTDALARRGDATGADRAS